MYTHDSVNVLLHFKVWHVPSTSAEEAATSAKKVENLIQGQEGVILKSEKITIQTLAYPIKKHSSGYFTVAEFQLQEDKIKLIKTELDKDKEILKIRLTEYRQFFKRISDINKIINNKNKK